MMKLLLTVFLALALVNQVAHPHSGTETVQIRACVPGQTSPVIYFVNEFDDDRRQDRTLSLTLLAPFFDHLSVLAGRCHDRRQIASPRDRPPLYKLNVVFLI